MSAFFRPALALCLCLAAPRLPRAQDREEAMRMAKAVQALADQKRKEMEAAVRQAEMGDMGGEMPPNGERPDFSAPASARAPSPAYEGEGTVEVTVLSRPEAPKKSRKRRRAAKKKKTPASSAKKQAARR